MVSATAAPGRKYGMGTQASSGISEIAFRVALFAGAVIEKRTPRRRQVATTLWS
ncbi:MAG: hypothetical protein ACRDJF_03620 [Actinomycetota bacterium]